MYGLIEQLTLTLVSQAEAAPRGGLGQILFPFIIMMGILWFLVLRPQAKERKRHDEMVSALKRGDEVITSSGIRGSIANIDDQFFTLEVDRNVRIRFLKSAVTKKFEDKAAKEAQPEEKKA